MEAKPAACMNLRRTVNFFKLLVIALPFSQERHGCTAAETVSAQHNASSQMKHINIARKNTRDLAKFAAVREQ